MNRPTNQSIYMEPVNVAYGEPQGSYTDDLAQMEQNLAQIYKENMTIMTQSLEQYKNELIVFQKKYDMLRDDYQYNLQVIKERDDELRKCDTVSKMKNTESELQGQVQTLRTQLTNMSNKNQELQNKVNSTNSSMQQKEQEHQMAISNLQQQLDMAHRQTDIIRSNVETEVRKRLQTETTRLQEEIHMRDSRIHEIEVHNQQLVTKLNALQNVQAAAVNDIAKLQGIIEENQRTQSSLSSHNQDLTNQCRVFEKQVQTQNGTITELKRQLKQQQIDATNQMQEIIESQKVEMQRQADAYEQQLEAMKQHVNGVKEREKQRVAAIKAKMTTAQNDLQSLTRTFRISSPYTNIPASPMRFHLPQNMAEQSKPVVENPETTEVRGQNTRF